MKLSWTYLLVVLAACGKDGDAKKQPAGPPPAAEVGVVTVEAKPVTLTRELPGRTSAFRVAEVRARVNGIVLKRLFTEGATVKAGQPLYKIDPEPYQAALESARAQLMRAEATVDAAKAQAERYAKLIETNAVSRQEYEDAVAKLKTANADVAAARASMKAAKINLDFTNVESPITGRIGRSEVTEGAYVQASQATLMATVQELDPVYVDMTWSSAEMMRMRRALESGELQTGAERSEATGGGSPAGSAGRAGGQAPRGLDGKAKVGIVLEDGREYEQPGALQFTDVSVDQGTGSISLRAIVPNPKGELLPGMFVRARIEEGTKPNAILVPQKAVTRDQNGRPLALVVDKAGKVERRQLVTDRAIGDSWLVTEGLAPGEMVVVDGSQRIRPGATVKPVPAGVKPPSTAGAGSGSQRAGR